MRTLIQHGTVVTASETFLADVAIDGETIVEIGKDISPEGFDKVVDASGKLVLPGAIDAHTHLAMPFGGTVSSDGYFAGTRAAACGGTTSGKRWWMPSSAGMRSAHQRLLWIILSTWQSRM